VIPLSSFSPHYRVSPEAMPNASNTIESQGDTQIRRGSDLRCWLERRQHRMAQAYSLDLCERVVAAVATGASCRQVAAIYRVSSPVW
jgi:hypothetical protein